VVQFLGSTSNFLIAGEEPTFKSMALEGFNQPICEQTLLNERDSANFARRPKQSKSPRTPEPEIILNMTPAACWYVTPVGVNGD
jgi:hypothetical protein